MNKSRTVSETYQKIEKWFDEHRGRDLFEKPWLDKAIKCLKPQATVLDIGSGMGEPIATYFVDRNFCVTGVDACKELVEMAGHRVPEAEFIIADMRTLSLNRKFDMVIAWCSIFHLEKDEQRAMFDVFVRHLNTGGILLFTTGPEEGEVWSDNGGQMLYHASLSPDEYKLLLRKHDFELTDYAITDRNCNDHTVWLAKYMGK